MPDPFARYALVADDDPLIRMDAAVILTEAGFRVLTATGAEDALAILDANGPSIRLLFTDVQMPPGARNGYDLARRCAGDWPKIGILVASGAQPPGPEDLPKGALFIGKPFTADTVKEGLHQLFPDC